MVLLILKRRLVIYKFKQVHWNNTRPYYNKGLPLVINTALLTLLGDPKATSIGLDGSKPFTIDNPYPFRDEA